MAAGPGSSFSFLWRCTGLLGFDWYVGLSDYQLIVGILDLKVVWIFHVVVDFAPGKKVPASGPWTICLFSPLLLFYSNQPDPQPLTFPVAQSYTKLLDYHPQLPFFVHLVNQSSKRH